MGYCCSKFDKEEKLESKERRIENEDVEKECAGRVTRNNDETEEDVKFSENALKVLSTNEAVNVCDFFYRFP